jgi:NhaP-type Na+/H+ or K+/H+ antiporter
MTVALALAAGIVAQSIARHLRVPGIVVLLGVGVLLGPDMAGVVVPSQLGDALLTLVGFAVAVILFEGGMNLELQRLRRENRAIRQLVTLGALVTLVGAALAAKLVMGWDWVPSILFGTLVIVTGPTVITPLLRRFRVEHQTATVLEAEGVLIDAVGAVVAIVALEVALSPSGLHMVTGALSVPFTLATGTVMGLLGGFLLAALLRVHGLIPEGLENVFTLGLVLVIFQTSNAIMPESGIAAATVAGIVVGNSPSHVRRELAEFKEQLTVMFIGMLFVLLAADVRIAEVQALGWPGVVTVALLVFVVRPLNVLVGTYGTELNLRQKAFISAIGPRGIVAAAIAAFFTAELERAGMGAGGELRAMVFLVIVLTVVFAGASGGLLARLLGLARREDSGWVILGANELARAMARSLVEGGEDAICIDTNPECCELAEQDGLRVLYGNGMREGVLARAEIDTRAGALALTPNTEVNLLFMQRAQEEHHGVSVMVAAGRAREATTRRMLGRAHAQMLFGQPDQLDLWSVRLRRDIARVERFEARQAVDGDGEFVLAGAPDGVLLALTVHSDGRVMPVGDELHHVRVGEQLDILVNQERADVAREWLAQRGLHPAPDEQGEGPGSDGAAEEKVQDPARDPQ